MGLHFTVQTDHSVLQWLMSFRQPEGVLARWIEKLQVYNFTVVHRPGTQHCNATTVYRCHCYSDCCCYCEKKDAQRDECLKSEVVCSVVELGGASAERGQAAVGLKGWERNQGMCSDIRPALAWVTAQHKPRREEVGVFSYTTQDTGQCLTPCAYITGCYKGDGQSQKQERQDGRWLCQGPSGNLGAQGLECRLQDQLESARSYRMQE